MPPKAAPPVAVADPSKFCYISCCNEYNVPEICSSSNCQLDLLLSWARQQFVASLSNIIQNCDEESKQKLSSIRNQLAQLKANSFELTDSAGMRLNVQEVSCIEFINSELI